MACNSRWARFGKFHHEHRQWHLSLFQLQPDTIKRGKDTGARCSIGGVDRFDTPRPIAASLFRSNSSRRAGLKVEVPDAIEIRLINHRQVDSKKCQSCPSAPNGAHIRPRQGTAGLVQTLSRPWRAQVDSSIIRYSSLPLDLAGTGRIDRYGLEMR